MTEYRYSECGHPVFFFFSFCFLSCLLLCFCFCFCFAFFVACAVLAGLEVLLWYSCHFLYGLAWGIRGRTDALDALNSPGRLAGGFGGRPCCGGWSKALRCRAGPVCLYLSAPKSISSVLHTNSHQTLQSKKATASTFRPPSKCSVIHTISISISISIPLDRRSTPALLHKHQPTLLPPAATACCHEKAHAL